MVALRREKVLVVDKYANQLKNDTSVVIIRNNGVSATHMSELRDVFFLKQSGDIFACKRKLIPIILEKAGFGKVDFENHSGAFLMCFSSDLPSMMKNILEFLKEKEIDEKLSILNGYDESKNALNNRELELLSKLPAKEVLYGKAAITALSPVIRMMGLKFLLIRLAFCIKFVNNK